MSALQIDKKDALDSSILGSIKTIRGQVVDAEILIKAPYTDQIPLQIKDKIEQLKQNIFDLDISLSERLVE